MFSLEGKIALITGASQGIGETIARQLAKQGPSPSALPGVHEGDLQKVVAGIQAEGGRADYVLLDMRDGDSIRAAVTLVLERHGALHILVNNAGITKDKLMIQMKEDEFELVLDINLKGAWLATQPPPGP